MGVERERKRERERERKAICICIYIHITIYNITNLKSYVRSLNYVKTIIIFD